MKDRIPLYPGRVKLVPVAGEENTYDLVRADRPTQDGTPLNKSSLLKDTTAALYGLDENALPDDVLAMLPESLKVESVPIQTSYALKDWNKVDFKESFSGYAHCAFINGKFVIVSTNADTAGTWSAITGYSSDGTNWETSQQYKNYSLSFNRYSQILYANGVMFMICSTVSYYYIASSVDDGKTWTFTKGSMSAGSNIDRFATDGTNVLGVPTNKDSNGSYAFVCNVSENGTVDVGGFYSGKYVQFDTDAFYPQDIAYGNGLWVIIVKATNYAINTYYYSSDRTTWTKGTFPSTDNWYRVAYCNGRFIAINDDGTVLCYSEDAVNWVKTSVPFNTTVNEIYYDGERFIVTNQKNGSDYGNGGIFVSAGSDFDSWEYIEVGFSNIELQAQFATDGSGKYIIGGAGEVLYSSDEFEYQYALTTPNGTQKTSEVAEALNSVKIETGSYTGTGTYGSSNPCSLTFGFEPKAVYLFQFTNGGSYVSGKLAVMLKGCDGSAVVPIVSSYGNVSLNGGMPILSETSDTFSWYVTGSNYLDANYQFNSSGVTYYYIAIG